MTNKLLCIIIALLAINTIILGVIATKINDTPTWGDIYQCRMSGKNYNECALDIRKRTPVTSVVGSVTIDRD